MPRRRLSPFPSLPFLLIALALSLLATLPLLIGPGIVNTRAGGDSPFLVQRVQQLTQNLRAGVFPARWMPEGAYGLGYPFFDFYAAAPYYLAALLDMAGCGVLWAIKLTQALGFVLAGAMMFLLARQLGAGRGAALAASAVYTFAPFHLVNVYVRGDALSEFYALGLYPLLLWAVGRLCARPSPWRIAVLAGSYGLLLITHNISALIYSPLLALWLVVQALASQGRPRGRILALGILGLALGFLLGAWFWLPALGEQSLVQLQEQTTGYFNYAGHFRAANLVQWHFLHDYTITPRRTPFSMGLVQALLALAGIAALAARFIRRRHLARTQGRDTGPETTGVLAALHPWHGLVVLALVGYTWLITPASAWVWAHVPLLPYVQFPWRLLGVQALLVGLLVIPLFDGWAGRASQGLGLALVVVMAVSGLALLRVDRLPLRAEDITPERLMLYETFSGNIGSTIRYEYLPREMVPRPYTSGVQLNDGRKPAPLALEGALRSASLLRRTPGAEEWALDLATPSLLAFQTTFYPGWEARIDGQLQPVEPLPGLGLVGLRVPAGAHRVNLHLGSTPLRRAADLTSLAGLVGWLGLLGYPLIRRAIVLLNGRRSGRTPAGQEENGADLHRWRRIVYVLCFAEFTVLSASMPALPAALQQGPLVMDFERAPYLHREPGGVLLGQALLKDYALSATQLQAGEVVRLVLTWQRPYPDYQVRIELVGATTHLWEPGPVWAASSANVQDAQLTLELDLPADIPPGLYVLRLTLSQGGVSQQARTLQGWSMGTLHLRPLQVAEGRPATGQERVLASFGPENVPPVISLVGVVPAHPRSGMVETTLTWRSERQAPLNYMLSLRLKRADGEQIASRDLPPLLGGYPTSLWQPGELVTDRVLLPVSEDKLLPGQYILEVVLYDRSTLQGAGMATIQDVTLP